MTQIRTEQFIKVTNMKTTGSQLPLDEANMCDVLTSLTRVQPCCDSCRKAHADEVMM